MFRLRGLLANECPGIVDLRCGKVFLDVEADLNHAVADGSPNLLDFRQLHQGAFKRLGDERLHAFSIRSWQCHKDDSKALDQRRIFLAPKRQKRTGPSQQDNQNGEDR